MFVFFFKQKTAYEMRISDWSSDVCSSDLLGVGLAHDDVEIVGDHQDTAAEALADAVDQLVERDLAGEVDTLHRLVEHQQGRPPDLRAGQQRALELAAGELLHRRRREMADADLGERPLEDRKSTRLNSSH